MTIRTKFLGVLLLAFLQENTAVCGGRGFSLYPLARSRPPLSSGAHTSLAHAMEAGRPNAATGLYATTPMHQRYVGEHLVNNSIWGSRVRYLRTAEQRAPFRMYEGLPLEGQTYSVINGRLHWRGRPYLGELGYAMDERGIFYLHDMMEVGRFHHSSFLGGQPVASAGQLIFGGGNPVARGFLIHIDFFSGHYTPNPQHLFQALHSLHRSRMDLRFLRPMAARHLLDDAPWAWMSHHNLPNQMPISHNINLRNP